MAVRTSQTGERNMRRRSTTTAAADVALKAYAQKNSLASGGDIRLTAGGQPGDGQLWESSQQQGFHPGSGSSGRVQGGGVLDDYTATKLVSDVGRLSLDVAALQHSMDQLLERIPARDLTPLESPQQSPRDENYHGGGGGLSVLGAVFGGGAMSARGGVSARGGGASARLSGGGHRSSSFVRRQVQKCRSPSPKSALRKETAPPKPSSRSPPTTIQQGSPNSSVTHAPCDSPSCAPRVEATTRIGRRGSALSLKLPVALDPASLEA